MPFLTKKVGNFARPSSFPSTRFVADSSGAPFYYSSASSPRYTTGRGYDEMNGDFSRTRSYDDQEQASPSYAVEHLATFGYGPSFGLTNLSDGVRKLKQMELSHAIWAQKMVLRLKRNAIVVEDENMEIVEAFPLSMVSQVSAHISSDTRDIYNNLLFFVVNDQQQQQQSSNDVNSKSKQPQKVHGVNINGVVPTEMHIFQCVRISSEDVAEDIRKFLQGRGSSVPCGKRDTGFMPFPSVNGHHHKSSAINGRPLFRHFQQQSSSSGPDFTTTNGHGNGSTDYPPPPSVIGVGGTYRDPQAYPYPPNPREYPAAPFVGRNGGATFEVQAIPINAPSVFERDVNMLNRCFDDIERFVARIQQAAMFQREIETANKNRRMGGGGKRMDQSAMNPIGQRQIPPFFPTELEFVDIFQKFKYCFNLLAKLKNQIHEPNAPELLHFLFTPFALILDACTWGVGRHVVSQIYTPPLTLAAKILLENSLTSREKEVWISLGHAWTTPADKNSPKNILRSSGDFDEPYQPTFTHNRNFQGDVLLTDKLKQLALEEERLQRERDELAKREFALKQKEIVLLNREETLQRELESSSVTTPENIKPHDSNISRPVEVHRSAMDYSDSAQNSKKFVSNNNNSDNNKEETLVTPISVKQRAFLDQLKSKNAKIAQVTYDRSGQNQKELSVTKSEHLEILNDSKKWWECRNAYNHVGFVPHTILKMISVASVSNTNQDGSGLSHVQRQGHPHQPISVRVLPTSSSGQPAVSVNGNKEFSKGSGSSSTNIKANNNGASDSHHHRYPDYMSSKIGSRGEFRYF